MTERPKNLNEEHFGLGVTREEMVRGNPELTRMLEEGDKRDAEERKRRAAERRMPEIRTREQAEAYTAAIAIHDMLAATLIKIDNELHNPVATEHPAEEVMILNGVPLGNQLGSTYQALIQDRLAYLQEQRGTLQSFREQLAAAIQPMMQSPARPMSKEASQMVVGIIRRLGQMSDFKNNPLLHTTYTAVNKIKDHE